MLLAGVQDGGNRRWPGVHLVAVVAGTEAGVAADVGDHDADRVVLPEERSFCGCARRVNALAGLDAGGALVVELPSTKF